MTREPFNGKERRAYVRLQTFLPVRFKISGKKMSKIYSATTKNISHGGLCLEVQQDKEEIIDKLSADSLKLGIDLDTLIPDRGQPVSAKPVWVNSRVDWTRKPNSKHPVLLMGLEFESLTQEARKRIHDYLVDEFVKRYGEYN
ncbi:MAG: PilZ domain-containing protein [Desulfobacterales bacterium]